MGLTVTVEDKTVTCVIELPYYISVRYWLFSDGYRISGCNCCNGGLTASHTFETYGNFSVEVAFWENGREKIWHRSFTLTDPNDLPPSDGLNSFDVFRDRPIIIPAECTGDITLTASVEELAKFVPNDKTKYTSTVTSFVNLINVEIGGSSSITFEIDKDTVKSTVIESGEISDCDLSNLECIPAFYTGGQVYCQFSVGETDNEDGKFDVKWDMGMMFPSMPTWYEGNLSYDSQIIKNIINSDNSEVNFPESADYTRYDHTFNIDGWSEMPPFELAWYNDPKLGYAIRRACLSPPKFKFTLSNEDTSRVLLNNVTIRWAWNFNPTDIFMNMRTSGGKREKRSRIYTLPKGANETRLVGLDYPVFAIVDGYEKTEPSQIIKIYGQWNEYNESGDYYFPTTVLLEPVSGMDGPDFPTCLYKSVDHKLKSEDFIRITENGWMQGDRAIVLDGPTVAQDEHYRTINVEIANDLDPDDQRAVFVITTKPNTSIDDKVTVEELETYMKYIHFYNVTVPYESIVEIPRGSIDPIFFETLWQTYDKAAVLESIAEEPLYYINFSINKYPNLIPIYNGGSVKFSDQLTHAADGVRSSKIFYIDGKTPNVINMQNPTKHKYKVKFKYEYNVYKHVYVVNDDDIPGFVGEE